jgi:hypothetical protein
MYDKMIKIFLIISFLSGMISCEKRIDPKPDDLTQEILSIFPSSGPELTKVTINGNNFPLQSQYNLVLLGGFNIVPASSSTTEIVFNIPSGLSVGDYTVALFVGGVTVYSSLKFTVTKNGADIPFIPEGTIPVNAEIINNCFMGIRQGGVHPRLIFNSSDIERIKLMAQTDLFAKPTYDIIISKANDILPTPVLDWGLDGANLRISNIHTISNDQIPYLVLAYQFTKDVKYAARCWAQLDKMCSYQDWGAWRHFLDAGIAAKSVAIAYDGLYDYLTIEQRKKLVSAVRKFVLEPGKIQIETGTGAWQWYLSDNNWNGICHGGMIMAALACYESDPAFMSSVIAIAANGIPTYLNSLEPDGASEEGMMYWGYGLSNTFLALESMKRSLGTTYGLAEMNGFRKTGWFPYLVSGPAGTATMGDDYLYYGKSNKFLSYFWFARNASDANLARTHHNSCIERNSAKTEKMNGWFDLMFYDPLLVSQGSQVSSPLSSYISGADYMYVTESSSDPNSLYIGMHGGDNNASHGHLDAGTIFIQALGENFVVGNLGKEDPYPSDYFTVTPPDYSASPTNSANSRGRFYYYRTMTESKSCMVFNPDARPEQNPTGVASILNQAADNNGGFYIIDLALCYSRDVTDYKRGIKLNRNSGLITVQDEFIPKSRSTVYWIAQSPATDGLVISNNGKTATMIKNGKTFYAYIKSPDNATFEKVDRSETLINYLPETYQVFSSIMSGKNSINKWYGKLQIKLTGNGQSRSILRIDFSASAGLGTPGLINLSDWTTSN